jgi:hypothetical protein
MAMAMPLLAAPLVSEFLGRVDGKAFRGVARGASEDTRSLAAQLLAMTLRANEEQAKVIFLERAMTNVRGLLTAEIVRRDETSDGADTESDEDLSCTVCGRRGGQGNFFTVAPDDRIMCEGCHEDDPSAPEVTSFF